MDANLLIIHRVSVLFRVNVEVLVLVGVEDLVAHVALTLPLPAILLTGLGQVDLPYRPLASFIHRVRILDHRPAEAAPPELGLPSVLSFCLHFL